MAARLCAFCRTNPVSAGKGYCSGCFRTLDTELGDGWETAEWAKRMNADAVAEYRGNQRAESGVEYSPNWGGKRAGAGRPRGSRKS